MSPLLGNVLFICVGCLILQNMSSAQSITNFFPTVKGNLSRVTWAHAVNNLTYLTSTLNNSKIMMIEADVVLGTLAANTSVKIPIMAHPPSNVSNLSLEMFLKAVTDFNNNVNVSTSDNTTGSSSNGTTNSPGPNNGTNVSGVGTTNSTSDTSTAGANTTGTNNTVADGGVNSTNPNTGTNEAFNNSSGTNPNDTNPNITESNADAIKNSSGTTDTNTSLNSTAPNNTNTVNSSSLVNTAGVANSIAKKGVKLDFKTIEAFNGSLAIITDYSNASFPIWLNADILPGPVNSTVVPVNATQFLSLARQFGKATLSLGWTTAVGTAGTGSYTDRQIDEMIDTIKKHNITNEITFAVRSALAAESLLQMKKLLVGIKGSTLTLWSGETDKVNVTNLRTLIANIGLDRTFIDVPDHLMKQLNLNNLPAKPSSASLVSKMSGVVSILTFLLVVFA